MIFWGTRSRRAKRPLSPTLMNPEESEEYDEQSPERESRAKPQMKKRRHLSRTLVAESDTDSDVRVRERASPLLQQIHMASVGETILSEIQSDSEHPHSNESDDIQQVYDVPETQVTEQRRSTLDEIRIFNSQTLDHRCTAAFQNPHEGGKLHLQSAEHLAGQTVVSIPRYPVSENGDTQHRHEPENSGFVLQTRVPHLEDASQVHSGPEPETNECPQQQPETRTDTSHTEVRSQMLPTQHIRPDVI